MQAFENKKNKVINPSVIRSLVDKNNGMMRPAGFDSGEENASSGRFFSKRSIGHLGFTGTSFWIDPDNGFITVLLTNWYIRAEKILISENSDPGFMI
ncbi:MAG: hypothetical protein R2874_15920 [Desulfobacterales bacterium]